MRRNFQFVLLLLSTLIFLFYLLATRNDNFNLNKPNLITRSQPPQKRLLKNYPSDIKILFAGDAMFDRTIRQVAKGKGYNFILENIRDLLSKYDLVVINLEGPITDNQSKSVGTKIGERYNYIFTFDPSVTKILSDHNIRLVNIGNNHILDFGQEGLAQTLQYLKSGDIKFFGNVGPRLDFPRYAVVEIQGVKLGFVNYNQFVNNSVEAAIDDLGKIKNDVDFVFLYAHWGDEYLPRANDKIQKLAREFIDSGADLIIGTHPHVIQQQESYYGKRIYYSLGNFVFDQYFSKDTKKGLLVQVKINPTTKGLEFTEYRLSLNENGQTILLK